MKNLTHQNSTNDYCSSGTFSAQHRSEIKHILMLVLCALFFLSPTIQAQDVAFVGWDGLVGDKFSFVLLRDHAAGEIIYFTEEDYNAATDNFGTGEGHVAYTVPAGGLSENEVIVITEEAVANTFSVVGGGSAAHVAGTGAWSFSESDELYAYSSDTPAAPWNDVDAMHCFAYFQNIPLADQANQDPSSDFPNCIVIDFGVTPGNGAYNFNDASRVNTTLAALLNSGNWTQSATGLSLSSTDFTNQMIVTALPVELTTFTGRTAGKQNLLKWTAAGEEAFSHYELERSSDGAANWVLLGAVAGAGQVGQAQAYAYPDVAPPNSAYYRLRMVDLDGSFAYSSIIHLEQATAGELIVYPNPSSGQFTVRLLTDEPATLTLYDLNGRTVWRQLKASPDAFPLTQTESSLDVSVGSLPDGVYLLSVATASNRWTERVVVR